MARNRKRLFKPLSWVLVRAPLLPVEAFLALAQGHEQAGAFWHANGSETTPDSASARLALLVGGGHLVDAIQADTVGSDDVQQKRLRYQIRMSTRPTPYGTFAGVALCDTGPTSALAVDDLRHERSARPDMEWLLSFIAALEARDDVLQQLKLYVHPCLIFQGGRVELDDPTSLVEGAQTVSIRASEAVLAALNAARTSVPHNELVRTLMHQTGADKERSQTLVRELVDQGLLLTDLRPPLTIAAPGRYLLERMQSLAEPPEQTSDLSTALEALDHWAQLDALSAVQAWPSVDARFIALHKGPTTRIQVDLALGFRNATIGTSLLDTAADIAQLLFRLTPQPHGSPPMQSYRSAFLGRYGTDRRVPLLECLDPKTGLGTLGMQGNGKVDSHRLARRQATLQTLALNAMADHRLEVEIDDALVERLALWEPQAECLPISLDLCIMVLADSVAAVNAGNYRVVVGPNLGSRQAGRYLGRFAYLLGERGYDALREAAECERRHANDAIWAESVYLPKRLRMANVAIRPSVRSHEIALGVPGGVEPERTIPLAELTVGIQGDRLRLFWGNREVRVCAGHMLNSFNAPHISQFLEELGQDGVAQLSQFDWGQASGYTFLPRVTRDRAVLAPAQWRLSRESLGGKDALAAPHFRDRLRAFRDRWRLPRYVYLAEGDNRLLLDLDEREQADQLRLDLARRGELASIVVHEALPSPKHAWVEGIHGHALVELVVPMVRRPTQGQPASVFATAVLPKAAEASTNSLLNRVRPLGTDWLFVKMYGAADCEETLLARPVREFCDSQVRRARCASWFFIRYEDPDAHLRIRFRGDPNRMMSELLPDVCAWGMDLMATGQITHFAFDTYEREVERYGGPAGMAWAEALFAVDSASIVEMLDLIINGLNIDRLSLLAISVDRLLGDLGFDNRERLDWYKRQVVARHASGDDYRQRKAFLRTWFSSVQGLKAEAASLASILDTRGQLLLPLCQRWAELQGQGHLSVSRDTMLRSLVHMHCNRFVGVGHSQEEKVLGVLLRLLESLEKAPPAARH